jgi:hypothetical protein
MLVLQFAVGHPSWQRLRKAVGEARLMIAHRALDMGCTEQKVKALGRMGANRDGVTCVDKEVNPFPTNGPQYCLQGRQVGVSIGDDSDSHTVLT